MNVLDDYVKIRNMAVQHRKEALALLNEVNGASRDSVRAADQVGEYILNLGRVIKNIDYDVTRIERDSKDKA